MRLDSNRGSVELVKRYLSFVVVLFIIAFGTSLSIRANLGSSPISCPPYVLSLVPGAPCSMGVYVICMHIFFILSQIVLLRKNYQKIQLLQILVSFLFGFYTDVTMWMTSFLVIDSTSILGYCGRLVELLIGGGILAYGIAAEVKCDVLMLAGEGFPLAIAKVTKKDFGRVKICSDTGLVLCGVIFMFIYFGKWDWALVGPGTLISMFYVGYMVRVFSPHFGWLTRFFVPAGQKEEETSAPTENHPFVITISREYGSYGHAIGEKLAKALQVPLFDKEIINETATQLGYTPEFVADTEQNISTTKLWELIFTDKSIPESMNISHDDAIYVAQSRVIKATAAKQPCIIIGRCADWVLRGETNILKVFVTAREDFAVQKVMKMDGLDAEAAHKKIERINTARANHYWSYTNHQWTDAKNYDIVINSSTLGIDGAVELLTEIAKQRL